MSSSERAPGSPDLHGTDDEEATATTLAPLPGATDPSIVSSSTIVQPFQESEPDPLPGSSGRAATIRIATSGPAGLLGDELENTPVASAPCVTARQTPLGPPARRLGDELESTPVAPAPNSTLPQAFASPPKAAPGLSPRRPVPFAIVPPAVRAGPPPEPAATVVQDFELRVTDPAIVPPIPAPERREAPPVWSEPPPQWSQPPAAAVRQDPPAAPADRRPAPPPPPQLPLVKRPPMLALPPHGADLEGPGTGDGGSGVPTVPMSPLRARQASAPPAALPAAPVVTPDVTPQSVPAALLTPELPSPAGPPRPKADPLRERRMRAIQARLVRMSSVLLRKAEQKPPVWRVLLLGVIGGLLIAGAVAAFYLRGPDARPKQAAPAHGPPLKEFGTKVPESDHSVLDSFDEAVDFSKKK